MELGANLPSSGLTNGDTFQSTAQIFDSLGNPHDVTFQFEYDAGAFGGEDWEITATTPNGTPAFATTPQFSFNGDGSPNTD
ncbi:flagellar basal body FlgE domain-containing protein, partial [Bacillus sp. SIMBA_161]